MILLDIHISAVTAYATYDIDPIGGISLYRIL